MRDELDGRNIMPHDLDWGDVEDDAQRMMAEQESKRMTNDDRKEVLEGRIRNIVDCRCCPLNEDAVEKVAAFYLDGLGYTDEELNIPSVMEQAAALYEYENWTYGIRKEHDPS